MNPKISWHLGYLIVFFPDLHVPIDGALRYDGDGWQLFKLKNIINNQYVMISQVPVTSLMPVLWSFLILSLIALLIRVQSLEYSTNFNQSRISSSVPGDPISLPIILQSSQPRLPHFSPEYPSYTSSPSAPPSSQYSLKRYQLKDTKYNPQQHNLNQLQKNIIYNMQPPLQIFDVSRSITFQDYQLLEIKNVRIMLINPTDKFRFCVNQIYMDSEAVKRIEHRRLPLCLNPNNKYPFFFNLYVSEQKPIIFRTSVYFIISIYDGKQLVDEKIWPRQIITKVSQNHLKLVPIQSRFCNNPKNHTTLTIPNPYPYNIKINIQNQIQSQKNVYKQILIPSNKNFKTTIASKQSIIGITARPYQGYGVHGNGDNQPRFPKLYVPVYCVKPLEIDYFSIGVLNADRSVVEIVVPVSSNSREIIQIRNVEVSSNTQTVQIAPLGDFDQKIMPGGQHIGVFRLLAHIPKQPVQKTIIDIRITYVLQSSPKQILQSKRQLSFLQLRNPLSLQGRRFIDVTKPQPQHDIVLSNIFPIRNNLNLPLLLVRVIFDQKMFKLTWLKDRREYIYPNQKKDQFSLQYIGTRELKISPVKNIIMLQFNGNLFIPIQILIYDNTLQCIYNNIQQKCQNLPTLDYGYFRTNITKFKQLIIRNWNPTQKQIHIKLQQKPDNLLKMYGMNMSVSVFGGGGVDGFVSKFVNDTLVVFLKGGSFVWVSFGVFMLGEGTSGQVGFEINTANQRISKKIKFKVQNGTIALIPQTLRINSIYQKTVQYLNLVSTFSQPYKIRSTFVNNSHISIYFNNHSQIYQNQWIGLALVYQPFPNYSHTTSSTPSYTISQQVNPTPPTTNIKGGDNCCNNQYFITNYLHPHSLQQYKRFTYVSVRVVTTTDLQTNSTIIIDNTPPKLVSQDNFTISLINYKKYRGADSSREDAQSRNMADNKQYRIRVKNVFKEYIKIKPVLIPKSLYQDTKHYLSTIKRLKHLREQCYLCVNNQIAIKHNFSPQMVKSLFSLQSTPQQVTIQPLQNDQYYIGSHHQSRPSSHSSYHSSQNITQYIRRTVANGARICYRLNTTKYIRQLIQSYVINDIAQNYTSEVFHEFVEKEMENYREFGYYLEYDGFYEGILGVEKYCRNGIYGDGGGLPIFRFCKYVGIIVEPKREIILENQTQTDIVIKAGRDLRDSSQVFYLIILNNITKGQPHLIKINVTEPKLKILHTYPHKTPTRKQLSKLLKQKQSSQHLQPTSPHIKRLLSQTILVPYSGSPSTLTLTLHNPSTLSINITHVGFQNIQNTCVYRRIKIDSGYCGGFMIRNGEEKNVSFQIGGADMGMDMEVIRMYMYVGDQYYFRVDFVVEGLGDQSGSKVWNTLGLNALSLMFMVLVIWRLKKQIDYKQHTKKSQNKTRLLPQSSYFTLGTRIQRKARKLQQIPQQQIQAVKQIQQKRIKQFFNSSDQSQIAKRQQTQQEQPSIQILNVLKNNDKHNISVSEESSLDFIDLQALNKSTHGEVEGGDEGEAGEAGDAGEDKREEEQGSNHEYVRDEDGSQGSDADSNFTQGDVADVDYRGKVEDKKQDYGWGDPNKERKKQQDANSYYNVFFSQNPLKKKQSSGLFPWMNEHQRAHHHR